MMILLILIRGAPLGIFVPPSNTVVLCRYACILLGYYNKHKIFQSDSFIYEKYIFNCLSVCVQLQPQCFEDLDITPLFNSVEDWVYALIIVNCYVFEGLFLLNFKIMMVFLRMKEIPVIFINSNSGSSIKENMGGNPGIILACVRRFLRRVKLWYVAFLIIQMHCQRPLVAIQRFDY